MKRTRKLILALVVVMSLLMAMAVAIIPASAAEISAGTTLYLKPNSNWTKDNARFAAYFFGNGDAWVSMEKVEDGVYKVTSPNKNYKNVIFCRMNPNASANNWNNKWNQTADLTWNGTNNCFTVKAGTWDKGGGTWSTYTPPVQEHEHEVGTIKNSGTAATCTTAGVIATYNCTGNCGKTLDADANEITDTSIPALGHSIKDGECERCNVEVKTIYFSNNKNWTNLNVYSWIGDTDVNNGSWPGSALGEAIGTNEFGESIYKVEIPVDATHFIINGSVNDSTKQTVDIDISGITKNGIYLADEVSGKFSVNQWCRHTIVDGACACGAELTTQEMLSGTGTVVLGDLDLGEGDLVITGNVTVVLNGTIKAAGVTTTHETVRFEGDGKLAIPQGRIVLAGESKNMPVWVGDGYVFNEVTNQSKSEVGEDDSFNVVFRPSFGSTTHNKEILGGNIDAGLTFELQIWDGETKLFAGTINAELIKQAYAEGGAISIRVKNAPVGTYTVKLVIKSSVGITFTETLQEVEIKAVQSNDPIETPDDEFPQ